MFDQRGDRSSRSRPIQSLNPAPLASHPWCHQMLSIDLINRRTCLFFYPDNNLFLIQLVQRWIQTSMGVYLSSKTFFYLSPTLSLDQIFEALLPSPASTFLVMYEINFLITLSN